VKHDAEGRETLDEQPTDVIVGISKPYMGLQVIDWRARPR
jgi:hypothetical protein